jgi:hypothetical protein
VEFEKVEPCGGNPSLRRSTPLGKETPENPDKERGKAVVQSLAEQRGSS